MMKMDRWKFLAVVGGLVVALVTSLATPAAAVAYPTAYNTRHDYVTSATYQNDPTRCVERRIYLAEGHYNWHRHFYLAEWVIRDNFYLGAGWYTWKDCLDPLSNGNYNQTSNLDPDNPNWVSVNYSFTIWVVLPNYSTWGSSLDPLF
ncbi:hypothetical protein [Actinomadura sp. 9N407]|uniref:hypothetical protein n=1 Tax=Actinomadura sp. 9N407 TaxID=3375154 RepID=UPI0037B60E2B